MTNLKTSIITGANKFIPQESKKIKQPHWVTDKIKNFLRKRRESKSYPEKYSEYKRKLESNVNVLRSSSGKKNVRRLRDSKTPTSRSIRSLNGHITCEPEDIKKCLEKCVASLFYDDRGEIDDDKIVLYDSDPSILKEEV